MNDAEIIAYIQSFHVQCNLKFEILQALFHFDILINMTEWLYHHIKI